jgi:hypothetical protein
MERPKNGLTVALIKSLKLASKGKSYEVGDTGETRRLRIHVSSVSKSFYMSARWERAKPLQHCVLSACSRRHQRPAILRWPKRGPRRGSETRSVKSGSTRGNRMRKQPLPNW